MAQKIGNGGLVHRPRPEHRTGPGMGAFIPRSRWRHLIGIEEPALFSEPGLFMVTPQQTLYYHGAVQTMPFVRPHFAELVAALDFVIAHDYLARANIKARHRERLPPVFCARKGWHQKAGRWTRPCRVCGPRRVGGGQGVTPGDQHLALADMVGGVTTPVPSICSTRRGLVIADLQLALDIAGRAFAVLATMATAMS